ncbi:MAG: hypothetical protein ABJC61_09825, partial [Acidobacteriota bacterium]
MIPNTPRAPGTSRIARGVRLPPRVARALDAMWRRPVLRALRRAVNEGDSEGWLVGGAPRDLLLGRADPDLDAAISADPFQVAAMLARAGFGTVVPLSDASPRVARVAGRREI